MSGTLVLLGGLLLAQVHTAANDDLKLEVRRLIRQLDAPQLAERQAAENRLIEMGPEILDLLPESSERVSAEVAERVARIRQQLQHTMAESAGRASPVTLEGQWPLSEILAKIEKQTGNKIVFRGSQQPEGSPAVDPKLNVDFDQRPFWEVVDRLMDQAELGVYTYGQEKAVYVVPRPGRESSRVARASYSGPFRFEPVMIHAQRDLRAPSNQLLRLVLEVCWEPRLAPVTLKQRMADVEALDEKGRPLEVDAPEAVSEVFVTPDSMGGELEIPLKLPPRDVQQIARLKGTLTALLPSKAAAFRFDDIEHAKEVEQRVAGVTVTLEQVRKNREAWEVRLRVRFDEAEGALESHLNWIYDNEVYLEDADGKPVARPTLETTGQSENGIGVAYYFGVDGPLDDYTFVYKTPALILSKAFEYEIRDVELP